jgi:hypothetical protein
MVPNARHSVSTAADLAFHSPVDAGLVIGGCDGFFGRAGWMVRRRLLPATRAFYGIFRI